MMISVMEKNKKGKKEKEFKDNEMKTALGQKSRKRD